MKPEEQLQKEIIHYLNRKHPEVEYVISLGGFRLPIGQARKAKLLGYRAGEPDIFICEARWGLHGLYLELKTENVRIKKRNGEFASEHLKRQAEILTKRRVRGYFATFATGYTKATAIIDAYLNGPITESVNPYTELPGILKNMQKDLTILPGILNKC